MQKMREWGFPVALIASWMVAAAYTVSVLIGPDERVVPPAAAPPAVADSDVPAS
jgi:hypothetical protein